MTRRIAIPVLCVALIAGVLSAGSQGDSDTGSASARKVVGKVVTLSGQDDRLRVKPGGEGPAERLREGDELRLGDEILPGQGVKATLKLEVPKGVSDDRELVYVRSTEAKPHTVTVTRTGKNETKVEIEG